MSCCCRRCVYCTDKIFTAPSSVGDVALPILVKVTGKSVKFIDGYSIFFCAGKQGYSIVEQSMAGTEGGGEGRRSSAPGECCCIPPFGGCLPHSFTHCLKFPFLVQGQSEDVAHLDLLMDVGVCVCPTARCHWGFAP